MAHAASLSPSADDVMPVQFRAPAPVVCIQSKPELNDVHIFSALAHAASFTPSADDVIAVQFRAPEVVRGTKAIYLYIMWTLFLNR